MKGYDELDPVEQTAARDRWSAEIERRLAHLDLRSEFEAAGAPFSELVKGRVVTWYPKGT